tara:strand:+ start:6023 stop:6463 length:441 start_codon:yes stop_codon:yes gene_type:complete
MLVDGRCVTISQRVPAASSAVSRQRQAPLHDAGIAIGDCTHPDSERRLGAEMFRAGLPMPLLNTRFGPVSYSIYPRSPPMLEMCAARRFPQEAHHGGILAPRAGAAANSYSVVIISKQCNRYIATHVREQWRPAGCGGTSDAKPLA